MSEQDDSSTQEPAEGDRDDVLREEQEGKGYGSRYGSDEGKAEPELTEDDPG